MEMVPDGAISFASQDNCRGDNMLNLLLVDDEPGQIIGFSKMLQRLRPNYQIYSARNGFEAMKLADEQSFDMIFTDIQMPFMNGLEFLEKMHETEHAQLIVLSGYDYFEYAQKALSYGASAYLLKPLELTRLQEVLVRAERNIHEESQQVKEQEELSKQLNQMQSLYRSRILQEWITDTLQLNRLPEIERIISCPNAAYLCVTQVRYESAHNRRDIYSLLQEIMQEMNRILNAFGGSYSFIPDPKQNLIYTILDHSFREAEIRRQLYSLQIYQQCDVDIAIGVSGRSGNLIESVQHLVKEAETALKIRFYHLEELVYFHSDHPLDSGYMPSFSLKEEMELLDILRSGNSERVRPILAHIYARLLKDKYPLPERLRMRSRMFVTKLIEEIEHLREGELHDIFIREAEGITESARNIADLELEMVSLLEKVAFTLHEMRRTRRDQMMYQILSYIDEHYMEDISLDIIAAHFDLSSGYFSQYFKDRLNINFTTYLNQVRMTKAKQLLEQDSCKIYSIAAQVGYQDVKYFNRVFKKESGMTPEEYRKMIRMMKGK
ncbi:HTH-type transcriptional regulator YesS [compost metagenome]